MANAENLASQMYDIIKWNVQDLMLKPETMSYFKLVIHSAPDRWHCIFLEILTVPGGAPGKSQEVSFRDRDLYNHWFLSSTQQCTEGQDS